VPARVCPSASLRPGPVGRCGPLAALQTWVSIFTVRSWFVFIAVTACGGIPQLCAFAVTNLTTFASAAEKLLISVQASSRGTFFSIAALSTLARFAASSRIGVNSLKQGGICCCCGGICCPGGGAGGALFQFGAAPAPGKPIPGPTI